MHNIAERLRHLFETSTRPDGKPWTLQQVAEGTQLSVSYIWRLRTGRAANPTADVLERLASFFGVPVTYFVGANGAAPSSGAAEASIPKPHRRSTAANVAQGPQVEELLTRAASEHGIGRLQEAERLGREAVREARQSGDDLLVGRALTSLAETLVAAGKHEEAATLLQEALARLRGPQAQRHWVEALLVLSHLHYVEERFEQAYWHASRALLALDFQDVGQSLRFQALFRLATYARHLGRPWEARAYLEQALALAEGLGEEYRASALLRLGLALLDAGEPEAALQRLQEALEKHVRLKRPFDVTAAQHDIGLAYQRLGRWEEAVESLTKSLGSNEALGDVRAIVYNHMELGWCYANMGAPEAALRHAEAALALAQEHEWPSDVARARWHLGRVLAAIGRQEEAASHYEAAIQAFRELALRAELAHSLVEYGDLLMEQGETRRAAELFREAVSVTSAAPGARVPALLGVGPLAGELGARSQPDYL